MGEWEIIPEIDPEADIRSYFVDNERRVWLYAYRGDKATIGVRDFREVVIQGVTIDDPAHLLTAFSKAQVLFRISAFDPAFDWLWACLRATRDFRKTKAKTPQNGRPVSTRQPGVIRRKRGSKKAQKAKRRKA